MAEYWVHDKAAAGGDGLTIGNPLNEIPGAAFGNLHTWNLKYGSVFDFGAVHLTSGNNTLVRAYGDPADGNPVITGTNSPLFSCATANGAVTFEDISFVRSGAQAGTGLNMPQMSNATTGATLRRCMVAGFNTLIEANRTVKLTVENCDLRGSLTTFGIRGQAWNGVNCNNWRISNNTFDCGVDLELYVSDNTSGSNGSFNNLVVEDNSMVYSGSTPGGTSMFFRARCNATDYFATASVVVDTPDPGTHTLVRNTGGAWPNWPIGTVIFLAGWGQRKNFGTVTVTGGGGTTSVTVTDLGATLVNDAANNGRGAGIRDPLRAYNNPIIRRNVVRNRGLTPIFIDNFIGGLVEGNEITDTAANGPNAAALEAFNCLGTVARYNRIERMTYYDGPISGVDGVGIFWDGACEDCVAYGNYFADIRLTPTYGFAMGLFFCKNCTFHSNIVVNCAYGVSANGNATTGSLINNTISGAHHGIDINGVLANGAATINNNIIQRCNLGMRNFASLNISTNAWWQNVADNDFGAASLRDPEAITADPMLSASLRPMPGSPLIGAGLHLGYKRDFNGVQRPNPPSVGAHDVAQLRNSP